MGERVEPTLPWLAGSTPPLDSHLMEVGDTPQHLGWIKLHGGTPHQVAPGGTPPQGARVDSPPTLVLVALVLASGPRRLGTPLVTPAHPGNLPSRTMVVVAVAVALHQGPTSQECRAPLVPTQGLLHQHNPRPAQPLCHSQTPTLPRLQPLPRLLLLTSQLHQLEAWPA